MHEFFSENRWSAIGSLHLYTRAHRAGALSQESMGLMQSKVQCSGSRGGRFLRCALTAHAPVFAEEAKQYIEYVTDSLLYFRVFYVIK